MNCPACSAPIEGSPKFCARCGASTEGSARSVIGMAPPTEAEPRFDPFLGSTVGGRYKITKLLGEGGMGAVYLGEQNIGGTVRKVAIKTLHAHLSKDPKVLQRFERECATVAELQHPNTIQLYDFGKTDDDILYMVMEYVQGESLAAVLEKQGSLEPARTLHILQQICDALGEAHTLGIVHRDLKPENIVLTERAKDWVKVLDFGIAKRTEVQDKAEQRLTQQGTVLGTPPYMSPEQFTGKPIDARSDIYSIAVIGYEMLSGRLPFTALTPWEWATQHMTATPQGLTLTPTGAPMPEAMAGSIMRALSKDPNDRFPTTAAFYEALSSTPTMPEARAVSGGYAAAPPSMLGNFPSQPPPGSLQPGMPPGSAQLAQPMGLPPTTERKGLTLLGEPATGGMLAAGTGAFQSGPPPEGGQAQYGTPAAGSLAVPPPPKKGRAGASVGLAALALVGLLGVGGGIYALTKGSSPAPRPHAASKGTDPSTDPNQGPNPTNDPPSGRGRMPPLIDTSLPSLPVNVDPGALGGHNHHADAGAGPSPSTVPSSNTTPAADPRSCKQARATQLKMAQTPTPSAKMLKSFNVDRAKCINEGGHV